VLRALHRNTVTPRVRARVFHLRREGRLRGRHELVNSVRLFSHLANIGDTRSLIIHPASTTHRQLEAAERAKAGAGDDVVRLSIGIENRCEDRSIGRIWIEGLRDRIA